MKNQKLNILCLQGVNLALQDGSPASAYSVVARRVSLGRKLAVEFLQNTMFLVKLSKEFSSKFSIILFVGKKKTIIVSFLKGTWLGFLDTWCHR